MLRLPIALLATAALVAAAGMSHLARGRDRASAAARAAADARVRDQDIAFYQARAAADPAAARDRMQVAALHLQRARTTGSEDDLLRAEAWARASLHLRTSRNGAARVTLASSLMAQHRFNEAREVAVQLVRHDPDRASYRALLGEVDLEVGRYAEADSLFRSLPPTGDMLALGPRLARWAEVSGRPHEARRYLQSALTAATVRSGVPPEQLAWLHLRLGELELRYGTAGAARRQLRRGLAIMPGDHRLLAALARVEYGAGHPIRAIELAEAVTAERVDPATLGLLADAHATLGDSAQAASRLRAALASMRAQPGAFHRAWGLFLLDHGAEVPQVLARAQAELATRGDIYGLDLAAWALYRAGRPADALAPMRNALATGSRDPQLHLHARAIARAVIDSLTGGS